jgi:hypothetical protein
MALYIVGGLAIAAYGAYQKLTGANGPQEHPSTERQASQILPEEAVQMTTASAESDEPKTDRICDRINKDFITSFRFCTDEASLQRIVIAAFNSIGAQLLEQEWPVVPGRPQHGVGDLVFLYNATFYVVETKWLSQASGRTQHEQRRQGARDVKSQARTYAQAWWEREHKRSPTRGYACTNMHGLSLVIVM